MPMDGELMKPVDRQKICLNCDGKIPYDTVQCPYCFTQQQTDSTASKVFTPATSPLPNLYPPPYSSRLNPSEDVKTPLKTATAIQGNADQATSTELTPTSFWPILMLTLGSNLLTLGILQFFFSDHGLLRLEMNSSYWFLMVLVGIPLIYLSLKNLSNSDK